MAGFKANARVHYGAAYILTYLIQPTHYQQFPIFIHYFKQTFIKPNFVTPLKKYFNIFKRTPIRYNNLSSDFLTTRTFCWVVLGSTDSL